MDQFETEGPSKSTVRVRDYWPLVVYMLLVFVVFRLLGWNTPLSIFMLPVYGFIAGWILSAFLHLAEKVGWTYSLKWYSAILGLLWMLVKLSD